LEEAELYLTASYNALHPQVGVPLRYAYNQPLGGQNGTGPRVVSRDDIQFTARQTYMNHTQPSGVITNETQVQTESIRQAECTFLEYEGSQALYAIYNGIVPIDIDGFIRQVTYKVDERDKSPRGGAETYVSVNSEADPYVPRYNQRRATRESTRPRRRISIRQRFPQP
jgi:hypothetical protein